MFPYSVRLYPFDDNTMLTLSFFLGPIVGGAIGGFTNKVAIKMLFRPYEAKHIGKLHIPFTPGIIPKEKMRIARSIGSAISENLLSTEVLSKTLLSEEMESKIGAAVDSALAKLQADSRSLQTVLALPVGENEVKALVGRIDDNLTEAIYTKLDNPALGEEVARLAVSHAAAKIPDSNLGHLVSSTLTKMQQPITEMLAKNINEMLHTQSRGIVADLVRLESERLMQRPVASFVEGKQQQWAASVKKAVLTIYGKVIRNNLPQMMTALNVTKIIEDRIATMDMAETERLILSVMDKELKAIVWLGVLLGFIMGFLTNLI